MKNLFLAFAVVFGFAAFTVTGCGGSGETSVVAPEEDPAAANAMPADAQSEYEESMKSGGGSSGPGN